VVVVVVLDGVGRCWRGREDGVGISGGEVKMPCRAGRWGHAYLKMGGVEGEEDGFTREGSIVVSCDGSGCYVASSWGRKLKLELGNCGR
jgi:hypothetical protein